MEASSKPGNGVLGKRGRDSVGGRLENGDADEETEILNGLRELSFRKGRRLLEEVRHAVRSFRLLVKLPLQHLLRSPGVLCRPGSHCSVGLLDTANLLPTAMLSACIAQFIRVLATLFAMFFCAAALASDAAPPESERGSDAPEPGQHHVLAWLPLAVGHLPYRVLHCLEDGTRALRLEQDRRRWRRPSLVHCLPLLAHSADTSIRASRECAGSKG